MKRVIGILVVLMAVLPATGLVSVAVLMTTASRTCATAPPSVGDEAIIVPETSGLVFPLSDGTYTDTSSYGWRTDPFTGVRTFHEGSDLAAANGTPILAIADGVVAFAGLSGGFGGLVILEHTVDGERVASSYAHIYENRIHVTRGATVTAGQHIADVGSAGRSTGPHLHLQIHPGGVDQPTVNALEWLSRSGAAGVTDPAPATTSCESVEAP
ncbi:M23 family metallopeptidase [Microbacterium lacus]|uniref:M23 family metallopeptidase n=1 Tax=Microbacterium lacus TaxID=415217 RepID=UPI00384FE0D9